MEWLFLFKSLTIARHEVWLVCMTCDWSTWLHHLHTVLLLIQISTFVRIINLAHLSLILARSSPVNSSYNECHRSDARHSTPSWHAVENALLKHKAEKALDTPCTWTHSQDFKWHPTNNQSSIICMTFFLGKQIMKFLKWKFSITLQMNGTSAVKTQKLENIVWIAQMLMRLDSGAGGEAFNWIMTFLIILRRNKCPEKWHGILIKFIALSSQLSFHNSTEQM